MGPLGMAGVGGRIGLSAPQPHCRVHLPQGLQTGRSLLLLHRSGGAIQDSDGGGDSTLWLGKEQCSRPGLGMRKEERFEPLHLERGMDTAVRAG